MTKPTPVPGRHFAADSLTPRAHLEVLKKSLSTAHHKEVLQQVEAKVQQHLQQQSAAQQTQTAAQANSNKSKGS
jgi:hypothetical protein